MLIFFGGVLSSLAALAPVPGFAGGFVIGLLILVGACVVAGALSHVAPDD